MSLIDETIVPKLEDFVGEGKKYRDHDAVAKTLVEKDSFITRLQEEQAALRAELSALPKVDRSQEILDRLEALNRKEPVTERPITTQPERIEVKGLSEDDVFRLLSQREQKVRAEANVAKVKAVLKEKYGDNYPQALKSMAEKNGLGMNFLDTMAAESPQALLNLMGSEKSETLFTPPVSSVSPGFVPTSGNPRNETYYKQLLATDKKKYFSAEVQNQQYKDMMTLKEGYYS
jgi:hypothetical protein